MACCLLVPGNPHCLSPCVQVRGKPSVSLSEKMNLQEKDRLVQQQSSLGEDALRRKEEELEEAMENNEVCQVVCSPYSPPLPTTPSPTTPPHSSLPFTPPLSLTPPSRSLLPRNSLAVWLCPTCRGLAPTQCVWSPWQHLLKS